MADLQIKDRTDEESQELVEQFVRTTVGDRDSIDFNFEKDLIRAVKQMNAKRLLANDTEYLKRFSDMLVRMWEKVYLEDTIKIGRRQSKRFTRLFT